MRIDPFQSVRQSVGRSQHCCLHAAVQSDQQSADWFVFRFTVWRYLSRHHQLGCLVKVLWYCWAMSWVSCRSDVLVTTYCPIITLHTGSAQQLLTAIISHTANYKPTLFTVFTTSFPLHVHWLSPPRLVRFVRLDFSGYPSILQRPLRNIAELEVRLLFHRPRKLWLITCETNRPGLYLISE